MPGSPRFEAAYSNALAVVGRLTGNKQWLKINAVNKPISDQLSLVVTVKVKVTGHPLMHMYLQPLATSQEKVSC